MVENFALTGRKALITGGARGIGAGIAQALAKAGAAVMIGDVLHDVGAQTAAEIAKSGAKAAFVPLDVTDEASWAAAVDATISQLGGFDILINNAGIEITALVVDVDAADLRRMLDVNVVGTTLGMKHAFRAMRPAGYSATKPAVDRLTRVGAAEAGKLGYGVRVNCIYPGLVATDMGLKLATDVVSVGLWPNVEAAIGDVIGLTPLGRLGEIGDMADVTVFLCSDAARFVTGHGLAVDGGMGS